MRFIFIAICIVGLLYSVLMSSCTGCSRSGNRLAQQERARNKSFRAQMCIYDVASSSYKPLTGVIEIVHVDSLYHIGDTVALDNGDVFILRP